MKQFRTHYDNLKVARNAPLEVIRAAYKALSLRCHPDLNPGNADAARIMAIINTSYDVLSDPETGIWKPTIFQKPSSEPNFVSGLLRQEESVE